jgi:hypothetical protein
MHHYDLLTGSKTAGFLTNLWMTTVFLPIVQSGVGENGSRHENQRTNYHLVPLLICVSGGTGPVTSAFAGHENMPRKNELAGAVRRRTAPAALTLLGHP